MDNYQMGRSCGRPYRTTCGMNRMPAAERISKPQTMHSKEDMAERTSGQNTCNKNSGCSCRMPGMVSPEAEMYAHIDYLPPTMAYVPCQKFTGTFDLSRALQLGTVFPELCRPFCGKRGVRK